MVLTLVALVVVASLRQPALTAVDPTEAATTTDTPTAGDLADAADARADADDDAGDRDRDGSDAADARVDDAVVLPRDAPTTAPDPTDVPPCDLRGDDPGCIAWQLDVGAGDTATVTRGRLVSAAADGTVRAVNAATGAPQWETRLTAAGAVRLLPVVAATVPVAVGDGVVFLDVAEGIPIGTAAGLDVDAAIDANAWLLTVDDATIRAVSVTGDVSWRRGIGDDERPVLTTGAPYVVTGANRLTRLFGTTGTDRWATSFDGPIGAVVTSGSDVIVHVAGRDAALIGVSDRGDQRWRQPLDGDLRHLVADTRTAVAVVASDAGDVAVVLDAVRGTIRGRVPLADGDSGSPRPVLTGDHVVIARNSPTPELLVVTADDGSLAHRLPLDGTPRAVLAGQPTTAVVATDRSVTAVSLTDGRPLWQARTDADATLVSSVPPIVTDGRRITAIDPAAAG